MSIFLAESLRVIRGSAAIENSISARLRWLGHLARTDDTRRSTSIKPSPHVVQGLFARFWLSHEGSQRTISYARMTSLDSGIRIDEQRHGKSGLRELILH
jgi:hypothetical protein